MSPSKSRRWSPEDGIGQRSDEKIGARIPRRILNRFVCTLDGDEILAVTLHPAVSANPYLSFYATADKSGEMRFLWSDDDGSTLEASARIEVKP
ncbi:MAG: thiosulfate oxidation carrier complex protein SoxZ [Proteobacteria bacterium]|nr:thiosulfate oxidation carrier complex protein SoxZ [Pseudomonadota bacterium]